MADKNEDRELAKLLAGESKSGEGLESYARILDEVDSWKVPEVDKISSYARLQAKLEYREKNTLRVISLSWKKVTLVAASVSLLVVSFLFFIATDKVTIQTAFGEIKEVTLPDGSFATLNANTSLTYSSKSWDTDPKVKLTQGEAYFHGNHSQGFHVIAGAYQIGILGTRFNVKSQDQYFLTSCYEGEIKIASIASTDTLSAGEYLRIEQDNEWSKGLQEGNKPIWVDGQETNFKNAPLQEVFDALKNQFGIELAYSKEVDLGVRYSGSFLHGNTELALRMVCDPLGLKFKKIANKKYRISI